jgi:hypothetical protein
MRYPCSDGVDRDDAIERYLKLERELHQTLEGLGVLTRRREQLQQEMGDLIHNELGGIGMDAMRARPDHG